MSDWMNDWVSDAFVITLCYGMVPLYLIQTRIAAVAENSDKKKIIKLSELSAIERADDDNEIMLFKKSNYLNDETLFPSIDPTL